MAAEYRSGWCLGLLVYWSQTVYEVDVAMIGDRSSVRGEVVRGWYA
jgi:hypothetical protein